MPTPLNGGTRVVIDQKIIDRIDQVRPQYMDRTTFINFQLDGVLTLNWPSRQAPGAPAEGRGHSKEDKDVDFSVALRAEEAHVPPTAIKSPGKVTKEIPEDLKEHEAKIRAYWAVKPKNKTQQAWKLLMTELAKIKDRYGYSVLEDQLVLAEANRWQSVTLLKYEQYGRPRGNTQQEPNVLHPAHQVFAAEAF